MLLVPKALNELNLSESKFQTVQEISCLWNVMYMVNIAFSLVKYLYCWESDWLFSFKGLNLPPTSNISLENLFGWSD